MAIHTLLLDQGSCHNWCTRPFFAQLIENRQPDEVWEQAALSYAPTLILLQSFTLGLGGTPKPNPSHLFPTDRKRRLAGASCAGTRHTKAKSVTFDSKPLFTFTNPCGPLRPGHRVTPPLGFENSQIKNPFNAGDGSAHHVL